MHHKKINIERAFLVLSLSFGFIFSIIFPVFYEGDVQFHFDYATYQADVVVDRASVGSNANFGYDVELKSVQNDEYFNKYFKTKLKKVNKMEVHDQRAYTSRTIANDLSHIIPAVGVWLGYHIYPSIGVMIVIARILATLFYSFTLYLIIKKVKYGKNLFVFTALTPVMAIQGYSLSYDSFSFVLSCGLIASQINFIFREKIYLKDIVSTIFLFVDISGFLKIMVE
ncbi:DUF2142 domain-containing protein [Enterococcus nangangensis]